MSEYSEPIQKVFTDLFAAQTIPPSWVIKDLVVPGLMFVGAPPKAYKSTFTMAVALLTAGYDCKALPPQYSKVERGGPVLMYSYEASAGELRHMAEEGLRVKGRATEAILICDDPYTFRLDDPDGLQRLLFWLNERDPRLCILDPFRDFHSLDEKDSGEMNRLLRPLRQWAIQNEATIMVVHHTKKLQDDRNVYDNMDLRGSSALFGIADGVLMLSPRPHGQTQVRATFKRAPGWDKTLTLGFYERAGHYSHEQLTAVDELVLKSLDDEGRSFDALLASLGMSKEELTNVLKKLVNNELAQRGVAGWRKK